MSWRLFVDSTDGVSLEPEYDFLEDTRKIENRYRSRDASEFVYKWGEFDRFKMSVMFVNSEIKSIVNSWWSSNTDLLFKSESASAVHSVHLVSGRLPIGGFIKPYDTLFKGVIELEVY